ncbi:MAG: DEAD/DEAH box helicase [Candidatus Methylomirabilales bacterium]
MDGAQPTIEKFVQTLRHRLSQEWDAVYVRYIPPRKAQYAELSPSLPPPLEQAISKQRIQALYTHQVQAIEATRDGRHVLVATGTASGKSLIYHLPVLERLLKEPEGRALYLFPLKALAQDQLKNLEALLPPGVEITAAIFDGDTPPGTRNKLKARPPSILLSNPDILHLSLLPYHETWSTFFRSLRFVVVDELHTYRGIFGSHIAHVLRRLRRTCRHYGSDPQFIACSATVSNPSELAQGLTGLDFAVVKEDGSPQWGKYFVLVNPRRSPYTEATDLLLQCARAGLKVIAFTKARKVTELIAMWAKEADQTLTAQIRAYRAGYTPEERRAIEAGLFSEALQGVVSTSALELGIDVGGLDACILVGYPGSIISTWQRSGRVGRGDKEALIFLIALPDPLDQYFVRHPEEFFTRGFEAAILDPLNPQILEAHLTAAAAELPLRREEGALYGFDLAPHLDRLCREGQLLLSGKGDAYYARARHPQRQISIRSVGESYPVLEGRWTLGSVDSSRAMYECHPGAIYLHQGRQYEVTELNLAARKVSVREVEVSYYTQPLAEKETEILAVRARGELPGASTRFGILKVTERMIGYEKRRVFGQDRLGAYPLDLPPQTFETAGLWIEVPEQLGKDLQREGCHLMGSLHAAEHAMISLLPLFALCDRSDVGGISYAFHPQVEGPAVFLYDGYPGGIGLSERGFGELLNLTETTRRLLEECPCQAGCPSCIHSPKCGSGNKPLDKAGALRLLTRLLTEPLTKGMDRWVEHPRGEPRSTAARSEEETPPRVIILDVETQRSAEEVGGWQHRDRMGLAVAVTYDLYPAQYRIYTEQQASALIEELIGADLIIGFNLRRFDFGVLQAYTDRDLSTLPTLDILEAITAYLGFRVSLGHLAQATLGVAKQADGLQSLQWYKAGELQRVIDYCKADVDLTRSLYEFGRDHGYLLFLDHRGRAARLPVDFGRKPFPSREGSARIQTSRS